MRHRLLLAAVVVAASLVVPACSAGSGDGSDGRVDVVAGFYPLAWVAEQVGGDHVAVSNLTSPGGEPHDLELTPRQVAEVQDADLAVHLGGVQPAVDDAISSSGVRSLDVSKAARLDLAAPAEGGGEGGGGEGGGADGTDPHFWLDPTRMADVGDAVAKELASVDPANAGAYRANAKALRGDLEGLDAEVEAGLADCESDVIATSHAAFGYFARRYGLRQASIAGIDPGAEPTPAQMAALSRFVERNGVTTIYTETLVDPAAAEAVAAETGAKTAVLDPIEGVTDRSAAKDYPGLVRANLRALQAGLRCR